MITIISEISKYLIILLMICYTLSCFNIFKPSNLERMDSMLNKQIFYVFGIHFLSYLIYYLKIGGIDILIFYALQILVASLYMVVYHYIYKQSSRLITNNMSFLLLIGYTMLTRLDYDLAKKQFVIGTAVLIVVTVIPRYMVKLKKLKSYWKFYAVSGVLFLLTVFIPHVGISKYGSRNWIKIGPLSLQPMEFVKILFVFFLASMLSESTEFKQIVKVTAIAALHVLILVAEKDLGGAAIFFIIYVIMLYTATGKLYYLLGLLGGGSAVAVLGFMLFKDNLLKHVAVRILAWQDPWSYIINEGYQVAQSLFALGTGGFLGSGLTEGMPSLIPVAESDFIFSAIGEEYGVLFALALILICFSCFIAFMNAAMKCKRIFYKNLTVGFATCYIFQVLLNIGGVTKFIPSTGVTLPLVSYGLSSVLSTLIIFNIVQGVYIIENKEAEKIEKARKELSADTESAGAAGKRTKKNTGKSKAK